MRLREVWGYEGHGVLPVKDPFSGAGKGSVVVSRAWYDFVMLNARIMSASFDRLGCPFCNSHQEPIYEQGDEKFLPRYGCCQCNNWWGPKELR